MVAYDNKQWKGGCMYSKPSTESIKKRQKENHPDLERFQTHVSKKNLQKLFEISCITYKNLDC